jgi:dTDP-4-dehydrorhamnose 3,5-epimerase
VDLIELDIKGVFLLQLPVFSDERGSFQELWNATKMHIPGLDSDFVQDNTAFSRHRVLRGLHYQQPYPQAKLVTALQGEVFDVAVDLRPDSETFGKWTACTLTGGAGRALFIPAGFAHGYQVLSENAHVFYKCTEVYHPESEHALAWNDVDVNIRWPLDNPVVSAKDKAAPTLRETRERLTSGPPPHAS